MSTQSSLSVHQSQLYDKPVLVAPRPLDMVSYPTDTRVSTLLSMSADCGICCSTGSNRICLPFFLPLLAFSLGLPSSTAVLGLRVRFRILLAGGSGLGSVFPERMRICRSMTLSMMSRATSIMPLPRPCVTLENRWLLMGSLKTFRISSR